MLKLQRIESVLLFLIVLFLPTQLGKHFWPEFSFVYSLPIDYLSPTLYSWDLLVVSLCIIFILQGSHINRLALNLFFFFILTQTLSLLPNFASLGVGLVRLEQYFIAGLFGVYIASSKNPWAKTVIFCGFVLSILGESFLAVAQFLKMGTLGFWFLGERTFSISTPGISKFDFYGREFLRPYATFPHPNVLAGFMILGIVVLNSAKDLWRMPSKKSVEILLEQGQIKMTILGTTMLAALVILLTVSRVAIIAGLVFAAITLIKTRGRVLLLIAVIISLPILYTRFSSLLNFDNLTFVRREELSLVAFRVWTNSPFFGVGLNNFIPSASDLLISGPSRFLQPVHNIFLLALSETGMVGLIGLIVLLGYPIFLTFKLSPKPYLLNPILFLWGIIVFLGMFDHYFLTLPQGYRLLFFIWGLTLRLYI